MTSSTTLSAFKAVGSLSPLRERVANVIEASGSDGCIGDQVRDILMSPNMKDGSLNTRYSELERAGRIFRNGDTRPGASGHDQLIMRHVKYFDGETAPVLPKKKMTGFLAGLIFATNAVVEAGGYAEAKLALKAEIIKKAKTKIPSP